MSAGTTMHAVRMGRRRGWLEFVLSVRSSQDQWFYGFTALLAVGYVWFRRDAETGSDIPFASYAIPSLLAALLAFGIVVGPAYQLAMEKSDGTLLRHRAVPGGMVGYVSASLLYNALSLIPQTVVVLVPAFLLFEGLMADPSGWVTVAWVVVLGLLAMLPIGMVIGSLVPGVQKVGMWGMLPVLGLAGISGIFFPVQQLWGWVQVVAQMFPMYWTALGLRSAFLPDAAAAAEIGGSWRPVQTVFVLSVWAVAGALVTPIVLRRMARRQTGSEVEAAREATMQWTR